MVTLGMCFMVLDDNPTPSSIQHWLMRLAVVGFAQFFAFDVAMIVRSGGVEFVERVCVSPVAQRVTQYWNRAWCCLLGT